MMFSNCGAEEDYWESLGLQGDPTSQTSRSQPWTFTGRTNAEAEALIFGHLMRTVNSSEKTLILGKMEARRRGQHRIRWLDGITNSIGMSLSKFQATVKDREAWNAAVHGAANRTGLSDWTTTVRILNALLLDTQSNLRNHMMQITEPPSARGPEWLDQAELPSHSLNILPHPQTLITKLWMRNMLLFISSWHCGVL